jgi:thermostable 8-oxoguanine DNA glycosylase
MADPSDPPGGSPPGGRRSSEAEIARQAARIEAEERLAESSERRVRNLERQKEQLTEQIALANKLKATGDSLIGIDKQHLELQQELIELKLREEKLDELRKKIRASETELNAAREAHDTRRIAALEEVIRLDKIKAGNDLDSIARDRTAHGVKEAGAKSAEKWLKNILGYDQQFALLGERILDPVSGLTGAMGKLKAMNPAAMIGTVAMKSMELAVAQDAAVVNFRKATGASGEFDDNIRGLERSLFTAGVGAGEAGQAVQSLFLNVTDFTEMSETQQETLGKTVAVLNELGVASETVAKNMQFAIKVMGKSTEQAAALQRELFTFAQELGVSGDKMASDFAAMGPQIAALGTKGVGAFKQLEVQAKNTGLALTEILGIVEKFDKFDSAADSVSRLNALLGGPYLNALELVAETDPSKRFEILKDRIDDAGLSFDTMDYYQRKAIASAMGLNEQQLALMMRGKLDLIQEPQKSAADIEALAEQTKNFNTVMEELAQTAKMLAVSFGPLVSGIKLLFQRLQLLAPYMPIVGTAVTGLALKFNFLTAAQIKAFAPLAVAVLAYQILNKVFGLTEEKAAAVAIIVGGVLTYAMYTFAAGTTAATGGLNLLVAGLAMVATGVVVGFSPSVLFAIGALTIALFALAPAIIPLLPLLLPLGLAIGAIAVAAVGLASVFSLMSDGGMVNNLKLVAIEIATIVDKINELSTEKAIKLAASTSVTAESAALIKDLDTATLDKISTITTANTVATTNINQTNAAAAAGAGMSTGFEGPPPTINVNLSIDGKEFATTVNSVDVSKYIGGKSSSLYNSIVDMIGQGINTGKGAP